MHTMFAFAVNLTNCGFPSFVAAGLKSVAVNFGITGERSGGDLHQLNRYLYREKLD